MHEFMFLALLLTVYRLGYEFGGAAEQRKIKKELKKNVK
jgi:hypothetical protein